MQDWVEKGIEVMTKFAKENNISSISGDSRVIVELLSKKGVEIIKKFNGMFSIVLYNKKKKTLHLM